MVICDEALGPHDVAVLTRFDFSPPDGLCRKERMHELDVAQVEDIVCLELVIGLGLQVAVTDGVDVGIQQWKYRYGRGISKGGITQPNPNHAVALHGRISGDARRLGNDSIAMGITNTSTVASKLESVILALNRIAAMDPQMQRRKTVRASVADRLHASAGVSKK